uniref:Uncharacterized protein n=1 Tax=Anguilla anguilla TaxID=7936 RepID=A0A0E9R0Y8_ANGAN
MRDRFLQRTNLATSANGPEKNL